MPFISVKINHSLMLYKAKQIKNEKLLFRKAKQIRNKKLRKPLTLGSVTFESDAFSKVRGYTTVWPLHYLK